jgi:signal transduction histidine kinase
VAADSHQRSHLDARQIASLGVLGLGILLLFDELGLRVGPFVWPALMVVVGVAVIWRQLDEEQERRFREMASRIPGQPLESMVAGRTAWLRIGVGALFVVAGGGTVLAVSDSFPALRQGLIAFVVIVVGLSLVFGPWFVRLARELSDERRRRVRSEERATLATHLHDGVLQTLALIQRSADDPAQVARLARVQERELRSWLFDTAAPGEGTLADAVRRVVADVERDYDVTIDEVSVSAATVMDPAGDALVGALREAVVNAAKHSGADRIDVFVEAEPKRYVATVRDRGRGFDPAVVPSDRRGIAHSIRDRVARAGGRAEVRAGDDQGTEVEIEVPRR